MTKSTRYSPEVRERAVRLLHEHRDEYGSEWEAMGSIAAKIGCSAETLRAWVRRAEVDKGQRPGLTSDERAHLKALQRENRELRRANEILKAASVFLRDRARRSTGEVVSFIEAHRERFGVEPICSALQFAPATYYAARARPPSVRAQRDELLKIELQRVFDENYGVYGAEKLWRALNREGITIARCTVQRLMRDLGLQGARRGRGWRRTTIADEVAQRPRDLVERRF
jgi:putative transposase